MINEYLRSWYWVLEQGIVNVSDCQQWAGAMIERMAAPPAWICDMATIDTKFELSKRLRDHLEPWTAEDLRSDHAELQVALDYLGYLRGEISLRALLSSAAGNGHRLPGRPEHFHRLLSEFEKAEKSGAPPDDVKKATHDLCSRNFPRAARYFAMRFGSLDEIAREIEKSSS